MSPVFDPLNIVLLAIAVIVLWRLKSVLGTRTGNERPPIDPFPKKAEREPSYDNVVHLPGGQAPAADPPPSEPAWKGVTKEGSEEAAGIEAIAKAMPSFNAMEFLGGAKLAYEMVLDAFAKGDKQTLRNLLSKEVFESFASALDRRDKEGQKAVFQFVGVKSATIEGARLEGRKAQITIHFRSEQINGLFDKAGALIEGDDKTIQDTDDIWTFERDVNARDPNWRLIATDSDGSPG